MSFKYKPNLKGCKTREGEGLRVKEMEKGVSSKVKATDKELKPYVP